MQLCFELGLEWDILQFSDKLVQLSTKHGCCWIDQTCMSQSDVAIKRTLASIPDIFRILSAVVLLPGSLCVCIAKAYKEHNDYLEGLPQPSESDITSIPTLKAFVSACFGFDCLNYNGCCSWLDRMWPFQELRYSSKISVLWCDDTPRPCYRAGTGLEAPEDLG